MGLKSLLTDLESFDANNNSMDSYGFHDTPASSGGFNYGQSISIFDYNDAANNPYFPFRQRSLGYGDGRNGTPGHGADVSMGIFGRADSPEPYRKQRLPKLTDENGSGVWDVVDGASDSFVRGGLITAGKRALTDAARIGEYLLSANGLAFIAKSVGLQRTNPKLQEGAGFLGRNRLYNLGVNTVAQTLANFTGLHITRQGLLPIGRANYRVEQGYRVDSENDTKYEYHVRGEDPDTLGGTGNITDSLDVYKGNRLTSLYNRIISPTDMGSSTNPRTLDVDSFGGGLAVANEFKPYESELYEFSGGPHSVYGIGKTRLKRYYSSNKSALSFKQGTTEFLANDKSQYYISRDMGGINGGTDPDTGENINLSPATPLTPIIDFRKYTGKKGFSKYGRKNTAGQNLYAQYGYPGAVPQMNVGPGINSSQGEFPKVPINPDGSLNIKAPNLYKDQINNLDLVYHKGSIDSNTMPNGQPFPKDYIKFRIEAVDTDKPQSSQTMVFRAFLDSMNDDYKADWNEYNYNGRSEPFFTYSKFNRSVSFKFRIAAFSREEMRPLYRKLNYLVSTTAGDYKATRLRGNFMRLTIGDYFSRLPGFFTSIGLSWNKDYPWEVANTPDDTDMNELPHVLDVNCQYQPVHDFTPQKGHESPFILPIKYNKTNITSEQEWTRELPLYLDEDKGKSDIKWYESRNRGYKNRLQPSNGADDESSAGVGTSTTSATTIYTVKDGDSLSGIASNYDGVSYQDIAEANNIPDPYVIQPGDNLTIPGSN